MVMYRIAGPSGRLSFLRYLRQRIAYQPADRLEIYAVSHCGGMRRRARLCAISAFSICGLLLYQKKEKRYHLLWALIGFPVIWFYFYFFKSINRSCRYKQGEAPMTVEPHFRLDKRERIYYTKTATHNTVI